MNHYKDSQIGAVDLGKRINPVDRGTLVANSLSTDLFRNREISTSHVHFFFGGAGLFQTKLIHTPALETHYCHVVAPSISRPA